MAGRISSRVISSGWRQRQDFVVNQSSGERQYLPDIFFLKLRVFALEFSSIGIKGQGLKYPPNCKTEVTYAWFAVHPSVVNRDSVEFPLRVVLLEDTRTGR